MNKAHRYYVRSPDGRVAYGFDSESTASAVAMQYGVGAALVDTMAQTYQPVLQTVERVDGAPTLRLASMGGWGAGKGALEQDLLEAIKRGRVEVVHVYLIKGASAEARDPRGGTAMHWAAARGSREIADLLLRSGASVAPLDAAGRTPRDVAATKGHADLATWLDGR